MTNPTDTMVAGHGWENVAVSRLRFRHSAAIAIGALVALLGALPIATARWYLIPILLIPLVVLVWGWRTGTDVDADGVAVRALLATRRVPWSRITGFAPVDRRVVATLAGDATLALPAVGRADLPKLLRAAQAAQ
jgi:hypothetical protein